MNAKGVRAGIALVQELGPEAVIDWLDPDVEMLGPEPSPWDCHGRDEVVRFLSEFQPGSTALEVIEATDFGERVLLGIRRRYARSDRRDSYSVVSFRDGLVVLMRGFPTRDQALAELGQR